MQDLVAQSKFMVASALAGLGIDFLFLEMDVWLLRDPMTMFRTAEDDDIDIAIGQHFDNAYSINIGLYYVRVSKA